MGGWGLADDMGKGESWKRIKDGCDILCLGQTETIGAVNRNKIFRNYMRNVDWG